MKTNHPINLERYCRQTLLKEVGVEGQKRIMQKSILLVGVGGLGSTLAQLLCAAGVGRLVLVDPDTVSESNLQRQILYRTEEIGQPKVECAKRSLQRLNPHVEIEAHYTAFDPSNALKLSEDCQVIADGSDNAQTRYLMNDLSVGRKIPFVYGSIENFNGQATVFNLDENTATYRCLFPDLKNGGRPLNPGVFGTLPSFIASIQANECLKILGGFGHTLANRLLLFNLLDMQSSIVGISPSKNGRKDSLDSFKKIQFLKNDGTEVL